MKLGIALEPSEAGGYTACVPSLPGCISEGETAEEAMARVREPVDDDIACKKGLEVHGLARLTL